MIPITPGDGEWFMYQTVPDQDLWVHGPWALGTEAAIFSRDARYDLQATSATCAPAHVFQFSSTSGSDPRVRADTQQQAESLSYFDVFWVCAVVTLALVLLVALMKRSAAEKGAHAGAE
jgi:hypothetical protein